jgi:hypothetical protein
MDDVQAALAKVEAEIEALGAQLKEVVEEIKVARARQDEAEVAVLRRKEDKLRTEKEQLRAKELLLLQSEQGLLWHWLGPVGARSVGTAFLTQPVRRSTRAAHERDWRGCCHGEASADARCGEGVTQQFRAAHNMGEVPVSGL